MALIVRCPTCGQEYEVERDAVLLGTWRLGCPRCTTPPTPPRPPRDEPPGCMPDA